MKRLNELHSLTEKRQSVIIGDLNYQLIDFGQSYAGAQWYQFYEWDRDCFLYQNVCTQTRGGNTLEIFNLQNKIWQVVVLLESSCHNAIYVVTQVNHEEIKKLAPEYF